MAAERDCVVATGPTEQGALQLIRARLGLGAGRYWSGMEATVDASGGTGADRPPCHGTRKDGQPCRAFAMDGPWCQPHDPARAELVAAARAKGGAKASKLRAPEGRRAKLETPGQLRAFTGRLVHKLVEHRLDPETGRAALYGINVVSQLLKAHQLEERLAVLEERLQTKGARRWG